MKMAPKLVPVTADDVSRIVSWVTTAAMKPAMSQAEYVAFVLRAESSIISEVERIIRGRTP